MTIEQPTELQRRWNVVSLAQFRIVGFDYETQQYKVRNKNDKTLEHWIDAEIIDAIEYFAEEAASYNTNELMARKAERKRLFTALINGDEQESEEGKSAHGGAPKVKPKAF